MVATREVNMSLDFPERSHIMGLAKQCRSAGFIIGAILFGNEANACTEGGTGDVTQPKHLHIFIMD